MKEQNTDSDNELNQEDEELNQEDDFDDNDIIDEEHEELEQIIEANKDSESKRKYIEKFDDTKLYFDEDDDAEQEDEDIRFKTIENEKAQSDKDAFAKKQKKEIKDNAKKEDRKVRAATFKKVLYNNLTLKSGSAWLNFWIAISSYVDILLNLSTIVIMFTSLLFALYYVSIGNWYMSLTAVIVALVTGFINERLNK